MGTGCHTRCDIVHQVHEGFHMDGPTCLIVDVAVAQH